MRKTLIAGIAAGAFIAAAAALPASAAEGDAQLSVLHAVPGVTVDVYEIGRASCRERVLAGV